jgi:peptidoglycan/LPS O-acetylase OafA/YrhL
MKFTSLDALRGLCALVVVLVHVPIESHIHASRIVNHGGLAVDFFFVLSGFVIAHAYGGRLNSTSDLPGFAIRRFGRVYPLHALMLVALLALEVAKLLATSALGVSAGQAPFEGTNTLSSLLASVALLNGLGLYSGYVWNGPSWSISTEFYVYFLFAGAWLLPRRMTVCALLALAAGVALLINQTAGLHLTRVTGGGLLACIYGFFLGVLTHRAFKLSSRPMPPGAEWLAAAALAAVFMGWAPLSSVTAPLIFAAAIYVIAQERGVVSSALQTPAPQFLGAISYSIYLVHYPFITGLAAAARAVQALTGTPLFVEQGKDQLFVWGGPWVGDLITCAILLVVIVLSAFTYKWVEVPARDYFNRVADAYTKSRRPAVEPTPL